MIDESTKINRVIQTTVLLENRVSRELPVQGPPLGIDIMYLVLADRNMQVRFGLKVVWEI